MSARAALKLATAEDHERVDRLFGRLDLSQPGDYRRFMVAQAAAHLPIEAALEAAGVPSLVPDWSDRRRSALLHADLADLGAKPPAPIGPPPLAGEAAMLGAVYVLEGSRLGGAMLQRALAEGAPRRFLAAEQAPGAWRKLLALLDECLYDPARVEEASATARQVFRRFEAAGRHLMES